MRVACEQMSKSNNMVEYFPGYEIMMDDLRDYRYFEQDMIHPNILQETIFGIFLAKIILMILLEYS